MDESHFGSVNTKPIWPKAAKCPKDYPEKPCHSFYNHFPPC